MYLILNLSHSLTKMSQMIHRTKTEFTDVIVTEVERYRRQSDTFKSDMKVEIFKGDYSDYDTIYIHLYDGHFYVLLHEPSDQPNKLYIYDGANLCEDPLIAGYLKELFKKDFIIGHYWGQIKVDQCGGAAVIIALRLLQHDKWRKKSRIPWPTNLYPIKSIRDDLNKRYHKKRQSEFLYPRGFHSAYDQTRQDVCNKCGKTFRSKDLRTLNAHRLKCRGPGVNE